VTEDETERLRVEAAMWYARMMRSDAEQYHAAFEAWLQADDCHRQVYDRIRGHHERSGVLALTPEGRMGPSTLRRRFLGIGLGVAGIGGGIAAAAVMLLTLSSVQTRLFGPGITQRESMAASADAPRHLDTRRGEIRSETLPDGSKVVLDTAARLELAFDGKERRLTLTSGRARFEVSHEARPFIVTAGNGAITARGTIFDVEVRDGGQVQVTLLRGAIDVSVRDGGQSQPVVRRLAVDQRTTFSPAGFTAPPQPISEAASEWPTGLLDVESLPLAELLAQANRYAVVPITVENADLGGLKVSGRFRIDQPDLFARNVADLFDLTIDRSQPDRIVLERKM